MATQFKEAVSLFMERRLKLKDGTNKTLFNLNKSESAN